MRQLFLAISVVFAVWAPVPGFAATISTTQLCWRGDGSTNVFQYCSVSGGSDAIHKLTPNPGSADQIFDGSATANGDAGLWRVGLSVSVADYQRDMYIWSTTSSETAIATTASATDKMSDVITVLGGTGDYSLSYVFSVDGTLSSSSSLMVPQFCLGLLMDQGVHGANSNCILATQTLPATITLSYSNLHFGVPVASLIDIGVTGLIEPIFPDQIPALGGSTITGSMQADFGSTVKLESVLVTDSNGVPVQGVSISSQDGVKYQLDPRNSLVPEPAWLSPVGLLALALFRRLRSRRGYQSTTLPSSAS